MWCIQKITPLYRERMYSILDLYQEEYDPKRPVIGFDEKPKQLLGDKRTPIPMKPGCPEKYDYEYVRNGTANIFMAVEPKAGRRFVQVTDRRKKPDFAYIMKRLVDVEYRDAEVIRIVLDNLNTHTEKAIRETLGDEEAERILKKIEFHFTPVHASWLNVAEIEINVMDIECTGRRIANKEFLVKEVAAWNKRRNEDKKKINWTFTKEKADKKLAKYYIV